MSNVSARLNCMASVMTAVSKGTTVSICFMLTAMKNASDGTSLRSVISRCLLSLLCALVRSVAAFVGGNQRSHEERNYGCWP